MREQKKKRGLWLFVLLVMCLVMLPVNGVQAASKTVCTRDDGTWLFPLSEYYYKNKISDYAGCAGSGKCKVCGQVHMNWCSKDCDKYHTPYPNYGLDVEASKDTVVMAMRDGIVYYRDFVDKSGRGKYVIIEHPINDTYSYYSLYQHLNSINSKKFPNGSTVKAGDKVGGVGNTGAGSGSHLHFEVFIGYKGGGSTLVTKGVDSCIGKGYYSTSYLKSSGIRLGAIITNPSAKCDPQPQNVCYGSVNYKYHQGSITYVFDKTKVGGTKLQQTSRIGTYEVGVKFTGMKEGRVIRKGKTDKTDIIVHLPVGAKVYVKEEYANENVAKVVYKANNTTYEGYMYIADKAGKQKFTKISDKDITPKAITTTPVVTATAATNISINKNVSFKWNAVANATKYLVTIKDGSKEIVKKEITGTTFSYTFANQGNYSVTVQAKNDAFWSNNSSPVAVVAYQPVTVTFMDYDGTVISKQTISYGGDAKAPTTPTGRKGYTFREWDKSYRAIKADTVITAKYDINKYKVRFFDGNGVQIGATQYVTYMTDAKAPAAEDVTVKDGYTFVQWDKKFTSVTSDTDVYALTAWENDNLPITVVTGKAEQNIDDGVVSSYTVTATLRNINTEDTTGRAIVALTTKDGDLLTATESNAFTVKNGVDFTLNITVPYKGQATNAEIYIVNGYQYTSNSFKKDGTIPISKKYSVTCQKSVDALAFTDWTTEKAPTDALGVESKKQYASRSVSTTKQYKHVFYPNNWSAYTTTTLTASGTRKVTSKKQYRYRDVGAWSAEKSTTTKPTEGTLLTVTGSSTAYYYYHYMNQYTNGSTGADSVASGSRNGCTIKKNLGKCVYKRSSKITSTCNYGDIGGKQQYSVSTGCSKLSGVTSRSGHCGSSGWTFWYYDKAVTTYKYKTREWGAWSAWQDGAVSSSTTRGVETRTIYAYKDAKIVYNSDPNYTLAGYTKESTTLNSSNTTYGNWSDWSDTKVSGSNLEVKERTVYRWKTKEEIVTGDTVEGTTKIVNGTLPSDFAGKQAILFVYKNADASDYTTEYLGQTTITEDGSYNFEFLTREEPSVMTGDFTATLGVEGTDAVMILDASNYGDPNQFKAPTEEFAVEFVDNEGNVISTQKVKRGESAVLPEKVPLIEGYTFIGWSANVTDIQGDYTVENDNPIRAQYEINTYEVLYVDWSTDKMETIVYEHGEALRAPVELELLSATEGRTKIWSHSFDGTCMVTDNMVVTAHEETQTFTVQYYDLDGNVYATDSVDYGESVQLINSYNLSTDEILVYGWTLNVTDEELTYVTQNIEARPQFSYYESATVPVASVESGAYSEEQKVTLSTDDVDADIYYTLDGTDPKNSGYLFSYPITIDSTCVLRTYAKLENTNDSAEAIYYYAINKDSIEDSDWYLLEDLPEEVTSNQERYELESKIGYRYDVTKQVMSDEEATALKNEGWNQVGDVVYTAYSDYLTELPEGIGAAEVEVVVNEDGSELYRYRYGIWTFMNQSKWQTTKPDVEKYETDTIYRYKLPKQCILTLVTQGEEPKNEFVYLNETLDIDLSKYLSPGEVIVGLYKDAELTQAWDMEKDIITESTTLYLSKEYKKIKVSYYDKDGILITDNEILYGENAGDIPAPEVEGYTFVGWDKSLHNITEDTSFYAQYKENAIAKDVKLNVTKKSLFTATSYQLNVTVDGSDDYENLEWISSNDNIADVSKNGLVTGVHAGSATITVVLDSGERASCAVTIVGDEDYELLLKTVSELQVNRNNDTVTVSKATTVIQLKAEFVNTEVAVCNAVGAPMEDEDVVTTACTVTDENDELDVVIPGDVNCDASVDETDYDEISEMISAGLDQLDVGTARYCAADMNGDYLIDTVDLVILSDVLNLSGQESVPVTSITLDKESCNLNVGEKTTIKESVLPQGATNCAVTWSSSDEKIVIVDQEGNITAVAEGTVKITATAKDGSGVNATCDVTVVKKEESTQDSTTQEPSTQEPTTGESTTQDSSTQEPSTQESTTGESTTQDPSTQEPSTQEPITGESTTQEPSTQQPSTDSSIATDNLPTVGTKKTLSGGQYKITKSTVTEKEVIFVKPKSNSKKSLSIPATVTIDGYTYKVTAIADKAFKNNKKLKSVTIGKNVTKIGKKAFSGCKKLKKITIKSTVLKSVGKNAIKNIDKKATIKVPKKQLSKYKKLFKSKTGFKKTMKIKK